MAVTRSPPTGQRVRQVAVLPEFPVEPLSYSQAPRHPARVCGVNRSHGGRRQMRAPSDGRSRSVHGQRLDVGSRQAPADYGRMPIALRLGILNRPCSSRRDFGPAAAIAIEPRCRCGRSAHDPADCNKTADSGSIPSRNGRLYLRQAAPGSADAIAASKSR